MLGRINQLIRNLLSSLVLIDIHVSMPDVLGTRAEAGETRLAFNILNIFTMLNCLRLVEAKERLARGLAWMDPGYLSPVLAQITYLYRLSGFYEAAEVFSEYSTRIQRASNRGADRDEVDWIIKCVLDFLPPPSVLRFSDRLNFSLQSSKRRPRSDMRLRFRADGRRPPVHLPPPALCRGPGECRQREHRHCDVHLRCDRERRSICDSFRPAGTDHMPALSSAEHGARDRRRS